MSTTLITEFSAIEDSIVAVTHDLRCLAEAFNTTGNIHMAHVLRDLADELRDQRQRIREALSAHVDSELQNAKESAASMLQVALGHRGDLEPSDNSES